MALVPEPPYVDRPIDPYAKIGAGANYGMCDPNGCTIDHSMYGNLSSTDAWFRRRDVASLTPWGIGGEVDGQLDGVIYRWMDYAKYSGMTPTVQPWSSGPYRAPGYGDGAAFVAKYTVNGINGCAQAIETSDGGAAQKPMTAKQWKSLIWLKASIAHRYGITSETYRQHLAFMHHREFTQPSYKDCPFPRIYNFTAQYLKAIETLMAYFEGKINDLDLLVFTIGTHTIDMRDVGRMRDNIPTPAPDPEPEKPSDNKWVAGASVRAKKEILTRESPSTSAKVGMTLKSGEFAKLVDGVVKTGNGMEWMDVLTVSGTGWVPKQDIELASKETTSPGPIFHDFTPNRTFTIGKGGATLRQYGNRSAKILKTFKSGEKFEADGYYHGEMVDGSDLWAVQNDDPRGQVHISGFVEKDWE